MGESNVASKKWVYSLYNSVIHLAQFALKIIFV